MAKKKSSSKALTNYDAELAELTQEAKEQEKPGGGNFIGISNGDFKYGDQVLPQPFKVVVLDFINENSYYGGIPYDQDNPMSPICFAIDKDEDAMAPHPNSPEPQSDTCEDCHFNRFGTDDRGRGKACKNARRLMLVPGDALDEIGPDTEAAMMRVPPTSIKYWKGHVNKITNVLKLPPLGIVTELSTEALDKGTGFSVHFEVAEKIGKGAIGKLLELRRSNNETLVKPFEPIAEEEQPKKKRGGKAKKAVKKKAASGRGKF